MIKNIKKIILILNYKERKKFIILIFMMFFAMILETVGIGSMIPLINYFTNESILLPFNINLSNFITNSSISDRNILHICLIAILIIYLIKNFYLALYGWLESKFAYKVRFDLGVKLFNHYLRSPYSFHIQNNTSALLTKIVQETTIYGGSLIQLSTLIIEIFIILGIGTFLLIIKPLETSIIILTGFILSATFYLVLKNTVLQLGEKRELAQKAKIKSLQQGLGAIKDIIIYQVEKNFIDIFKTNSDDVAEVGFKMHFLQKLPKIWFEIVTITIVIFVILFLSINNYKTSEIMATMTIFLFASLRLIPSVNRIIVALQNIKYSQPSINNLSNDLNHLILDNKEIINTKEENIEFKNSIEFNDVHFSYPQNNKQILKNINLKIKKNEFVGIVGETGSGKSTLIDLLIGLIKPNKGTITVDKKNINESLNSWKKNLGYVPQDLYLLDDSIQKNIAFGKKENQILNSAVKRSVDQSQLSQFIYNLNDGLKTIVGERGVKISGGEKQRVGIGRALYNDPEVLVFDEATSSLDLETERKILETLNYLKEIKTIIFVTHRISNLNICDRVFKIENNKITELKR